MCIAACTRRSRVRCLRGQERANIPGSRLLSDPWQLGSSRRHRTAQRTTNTKKGKNQSRVGCLVGPWIFGENFCLCATARHLTADKQNTRTRRETTKRSPAHKRKKQTTKPRTKTTRPPADLIHWSAVQRPNITKRKHTRVHTNTQTSKQRSWSRAATDPTNKQPVNNQTAGNAPCREEGPPADLASGCSPRGSSP